MSRRNFLTGVKVDGAIPTPLTTKLGAPDVGAASSSTLDGVIMSETEGSRGETSGSNPPNLVVARG
jgi:hypothetical protein